ncbi:hypothetical protein PILCRDRAFT_13246 [Piloderma croceum F 1598]|uniref:G domain-containing protein n=1 Tax=Piloderma croceum (strain F 1598) TaxID=765440 RepID=A0A0C3APN0_PILCF|nr:hypothetical protein PILCRDRAFT_13246 [Piloderma croceum F 1598]
MAGASNEAECDWYIYDLAPNLTSLLRQRNTIIFLAPIPCFDEQLAEDRNLSQTTLVLFMNKCDLLEKKIKSGVSVKKSLLSFGDRPNDAASVTKYLKTKFKEISQQCSPPSRTLYIFPTSVTDTQATGITLQTVRDGILREHLRHSNFV